MEYIVGVTSYTLVYGEFWASFFLTQHDTYARIDNKCTEVASG
jgi:hypothetical protein